MCRTVPNKRGGSPGISATYVDQRLRREVESAASAAIHSAVFERSARQMLTLDPSMAVVDVVGMVVKRSAVEEFANSYVTGSAEGTPHDSFMSRRRIPPAFGGPSTGQSSSCL